MKREANKLAAVLRQIAYDAGHALLCRGDPEITRFCVAQYNRIHARLRELDLDLAAPFGPLADDAGAGEVRIVARALSTYIMQKTGMARNRARVGVGCLDFFWPGCSLKFDVC